MDHVVVAALIRDARVLLAHRRADKRAYPGVWDLPGGTVEPGESQMQALCRELSEELGVQIVPSSVSLLAQVEGGPSDHPARISAWLVREWRGTPLNRAPEEHEAIGWFTLDGMPELVHPSVHLGVVAALGRDLR